MIGSCNHLLASHQDHPPQPEVRIGSQFQERCLDRFFLRPGRDTSPLSLSDWEMTRSCTVVISLPDWVARGWAPPPARAGVRRHDESRGGPRASRRGRTGGCGIAPVYSPSITPDASFSSRPDRLVWRRRGQAAPGSVRCRPRSRRSGTRYPPSGGVRRRQPQFASPR